MVDNGEVPSNFRDQEKLDDIEKGMVLLQMETKQAAKKLRVVCGKPWVI